MSPVTIKPPFLQAYTNALIPLLLISITLLALLTLSIVSLAQTAAPVVSAEANVVQNVEPSAVVTASSTTQSVSSVSSKQSDTIRQDLARIITSEDYASAQEITNWQAIEKPNNENVDMGWLETLLEAIFGSSNNAQSTIALSSLLLKALLIGVLIAFVVWVLRRAGYLAGWADRIGKHTGRRSTIKQANYPQQGWEQLPIHAQIPDIVKQYLADGEIIQAASILYRGSLRWLVVSEQLPVAAANTEQQCLAQIQQLAQFKDSKPHIFIRQIISLWVQTAYDEQQSAQNFESLNEQLRSCADNWLLQLHASDSTVSAIIAAKATDNLGVG